jgi:hypothetical protein
MSVDSADWRKNNPDKRYEQKRREKVRAALRKRGILPPAGEEMNDEQKFINEQISNNDFSYWETIKTQKTEKPKQSKILSPEQYIWNKTKKDAEKYGFDFNLTIEDIILPEKCAYLETNLIFDAKLSDNLNFYVLDRIDTNKGYIKDNIHFISRMASIMKYDATPEILINFAINILKVHNLNEDK